MICRNSAVSVVAAAADCAVGGDEQLRGAFDRAERVADLVRETGGHLAERGEAVALLDALVGLRRLDHARGADRELAERVDVVGVERALGAIVAHAEQAEQPRALLGLGRAEQREDQRRLQLLDARLAARRSAARLASASGAWPSSSSSRAS